MAAAGKRTKEESGPRIGASGKLEGEFVVKKDPEFLARRAEVWDRLYAEQQKKLEQSVAAGKRPITITLKDGSQKEGFAFETTPMDIALSISKSLAKDALVASVVYDEALASESDLSGDIMAVESDDEEEEEEKIEDVQKAIQWDLTRPLEASCQLDLMKFDSALGNEVYWHSSAHMLGAALEKLYGGYLGVGPPLESGFYYDIFVGSKKLGQDDFKAIEEEMQDLAKQAAPFQRLVMSKEEALELFKDNPFKVQLITAKVPEGSKTSAYRCGSLIDLCRGPHVPNTERVRHVMCTKNSSAYWLGNAEYDALQRIYGITFPNEKLMKDHKKFLEEAKQRDHRNIGTQQELFFFHAVVSPGSCFWQPMGARIYNKLIDFMRSEYRIRGFQEVITPNIYAAPLFQMSGHYQNYKDNMYGFDVEGQEWFLKPMNCPGHCMVFDHRVRSYKELPIRMASFGVLHRNELSGTLAGLTRVRRFQQDDAHIFCRPEQIKEEVLGALEFLMFVYKQFGFNSSVALSTRPKKAIGERAIWDSAEAAMKEVLNESGLNWSLNPGDGAFYGPKIDIRLTDAMGRKHQCGTIQLDFQLPIRFNLQYRSDEVESKEKEEDGGKAKEEAKEEEPKEAWKEEAKAEPDADSKGKKEYVWKEQKVKPGFKRPVMIHRAILGSVERMVAILTEHYAGKWPFWLNPRQVMVVPISNKYNDYATYVADQLSSFGFHSAVDTGGNTLDKKIRTAQLSQWSYMAVVGEKEEESMSVNLRSRDSKVPVGTFTLQELVEKFKSEDAPTSKPVGVFAEFKGRVPGS